MDIDGIGEETAQQLMVSGLVSNIADLYDLTEAKLMELDRFALKSAERIMAGLRRSLDVPFERVIFALSIPFVGETVAKKLARSVKNIETLMSMPVGQLTAIDDIGPKIAESIVGYFSVDTNRETVRRLQAAGLRMETVTVSETGNSDKLEGKTIVISGTFSLHSRDEYKEMIERNGGRNSGSISKKTDFILAGENMGPAKLEKAQKLGIVIIDENQFLEMIH